MTSSLRPTQAVILAGGRGTRLAPITDHTPKAMVEFSGKPFLEHIILMLRDQGITDVVLLLGWLPEVFTDHFGDGSSLGMTIQYRVTDPDDLTALRFQDAAHLVDDTFLLLYCDNHWPADLGRMVDHLESTGARNQVVVYDNLDGYTKNSVWVEDGMVRSFDKTQTNPKVQGVEISYAILQKADVLPLLPEDGNALFELVVYPQLAEQGKLAGYLSGHRYMSVGGHKRLPLTQRFFERRPTVLLDRDGTLHERAPKAQYVTRQEDIRWLPGAKEALRLLNEAGWAVHLVTNQAGINRGAVTREQVDEVNDALRGEAIAAGGRIDDVYLCPHDWEEGCRCRKPSPGMLFEAHRDHSLDLSRTFYLGDDVRDGQAAWNAGARFALVDDERTLLDRVKALLAGTLADESPEYRS